MMVYTKKQNIPMSGVLAITFKSYDEYNLFRDEALKPFINLMNCEDQQMVVLPYFHRFQKLRNEMKINLE